MLAIATCYGSITLGSLTATPHLQAQTIPDVSLGEDVSVVTPQGQTTEVTGGALRGSGLFHSFEALNVPQGRSLYFNHPSGITHIFSRVTGSDPSQIDGTLGLRGNADLFLLNPNGILFGSNAKLDLAGSFVASSAESLQFDDFEFGTASPQPVPMLTVSTPIGLNMGLNSGAVVNRSQADGTGLTVQPLQTLALVGGDIESIEGNITSHSGRLELGSVRNGTIGLTPNGSGWALDYAAVSERGNLQLRDRSMIQGISLENNPDSVIHLVAEEISLSEGATVASLVDFEGQGTPIVLEGDRIELRNGGVLLTRGQAGTGGKVTVEAAESLRIIASGDNPILGAGFSSIIQSDTLPGSSGQGGEINLKTPQLRLEDGGQIFSTTGFFSTGDGGEVTIGASESISFQNSIPTEFRTSVATETRGSGQGGNLSVTTAQLQFDQSYTMGSFSWLGGDGGDVSVEASSIDLNAANAFSSRLSSGIGTFAYGSGHGGDIRITTQDLSIANSAYVNTAAFSDRATTAQLFSQIYDPAFANLIDQPNAGTGKAGNIEIVAESIEVSAINPAPFATPSSIMSLTTGSGNTGDVDITTKSLSITQGATVGSSTAFSLALLGEPVLDSQHGNGGNLTVNAEQILLQGKDASSGIPSVLGTQTLSNGNAGTTKINTRKLSIEDGAWVAAGTFSSGHGGDLVVNATELIRVDGAAGDGEASTIGTFAAAPSPALQSFFFLYEEQLSGDIGELTLNTERLEILNGGVVSVAHEGIGDAGELEVNAKQVNLENHGQLLAFSASGRGGNMDLQIDELLLLRQGSQISAAALGDAGDGGNLDITAGAILAIPNENSDITADAISGKGGTVNITTHGIWGIEPRVQRTHQSDITSRSTVGIDGTITLTDLTPSTPETSPELPSHLLQPKTQIVAGCPSNNIAQFIVSGRGGLPTNPQHQLQQTLTLEDWRESPSPLSPERKRLDPIAQKQALSARRRNLRSQSKLPTESPNTAPPLTELTLEAQGIAMDALGKIHLTAGPSQSTSEFLASCQHLPELNSNPATAQQDGLPRGHGA